MTSPAEILGLPKPAWAGEDVAMLYDMATRFLSEEIAPRYDEFEKAEKFDKSKLDQGRRGRAAVRVHAGRVRRLRRYLRP